MLEVSALAFRDKTQRRDALTRALSHEGLTFSTDDYGGGVNFSFGTGGGVLFSAHYDNFPDSYGANDNLAAVCIMIELAKHVHADFVLTDGEESGHTGAKHYAETHGIQRVVNLDLCGYGDSIVMCAKGKGFRDFTSPELLTKHNAHLVRYLPPGDDVMYRKYHVPVLSVSIVPKWDVQYLKALASFGERLLGQPPEFDMIISQMEITQTIHNGAKDSPEYVQPEAMQRVYDYLYDAMTTEYTQKNIFRRFHDELRRIIQA